MAPHEGAALGRMVENHLATLLSASHPFTARNATVVQVNAPLQSGTGAASHATAMAIARGIHQSLNGKG
jgi:hypothetical protein